MTSLCIFGASSTWGAWDLEKGGWVNRLRLFIDNKDLGIAVYNLGVSGDTTEDLLRRFDVEAEARKPDMIIFSIGDNDAKANASGEYAASLEQFEKNISSLIQKGKMYTDKILFLGIKRVDENKTTPVLWDSDAWYRNKDIEIYDAKFRECVVAHGAAYMNIADVITTDDLFDGLHPNARGHEKIFHVVKNFYEF